MDCVLPRKAGGAACGGGRGRPLRTSESPEAEEEAAGSGEGRGVASVWGSLQGGPHVRPSRSAAS